MWHFWHTEFLVGKWNFMVAYSRLRKSCKTEQQNQTLHKSLLRLPQSFVFKSTVVLEIRLLQIYINFHVTSDPNVANLTSVARKMSVFHVFPRVLSACPVQVARAFTTTPSTTLKRPTFDGPLPPKRPV